MVLQAGTQFGAYRILGPLGQGGMASVYRAFQPSLRRDVAIKVIGSHLADNAEFRARFQREAEVLAQLEHPNILPVFDYGEVDGQAYIVYRYITGGVLKDLLGQPLPLDQVIPLLAPVAAALDFAHARGVVHRDVKPSNILLTAEHTPIVADFGLARMLGAGLRDPKAPPLTETGASMGTPAFMAPEQVLGLPVDGRADQYALGIIAYQMLTGSVPFSAETPMAVALQQVHEPPPLPSARHAGISPAVEQTLLVVLAKDPQDRFERCGTFVTALAESVSVPALPQGPGLYARPARTTSETMAPTADSSTNSPLDVDNRIDGGSAGVVAGTAGSRWRGRRRALVIGIAGLLLVGVGIATVAVLRRSGTHTDSSSTAASLSAAPSGAAAESGAGPAGSPTSPARSAVPPQVIFGAQLSKDWRNDSDPKQVAMQLPSPLKHGTHPSAKFSTLAPYAGLQLSSGGVSTNGYTHLRLFVHAEDAGPLPDLSVRGEGRGQYRQGTTLTSAAVVRSDEADGWTRLDVPLVWIGLDDDRLTLLAIASNADQAGIAFSVADLELVSLPAATVDAAQAGSVRFRASFDGKPVPGVVVLLSTGARLSTDAAGLAVFDGVPRGTLEYRITFPDSFEGSPLTESDEGRLTVKAGTSVDQTVPVVKTDLRVEEPANEVVVSLPVSLRWQAYPAAASYHVELDPHGPSESIERDTVQTSLTLGPELQSGTEYDYRVAAVNAAGVVIARSAAQYFRTP